VDIDRFIVRNQATWARLALLTNRARRGVRHLGATELDELVQLYQRASAHLSYARAAYRDPALSARLTMLVAGANGVIYGQPGGGTRAVARFFALTFPGAVWSSRRFIAASAALMFVPALVLGVWLTSSQRALDVAIPRTERDALIVAEQNYYSSEPAGEFSAKVLTNNIRVSIVAFAFGILLCVGTAAILVYNGLNVAVLGALFVSVGRGGEFFGLILPHGLLELSAVVVAGAAGLRLGWSVIAPGDRTRGEAVAIEGRRSVTIVIGLVLAFVVAGIVEGFVTPSGLATAVRVGVGVLVAAAFWAYVVTQGRAAESMGMTGVLGEKPPPAA